MMHSRRRPSVPRSLFLICIAAWTPAIVSATVKVVKQPAVVQTRTFDPANPPSEMPPLGKGENALTVCDYRCDVNSKFRTVDQRETADGFDADVKIFAVTLTVRLNVTIWIPDAAAPKLVAHEEGHRQIAERIYQDAEAIAKSVGKQMDERRVTGHGETGQAARRAAIETIARDTSNRYLDQTAVRAGRVNEIYDDLTAHGTRAEPAEAEAIRLAFEKDAKEKHPATKPAE